MNSRQQGFTIIEVVVSMVLMAIVLTTLGGLTYASARTALVTSEGTTRQAVSMGLVNRYVAMPYDSIPTTTTCDTVGSTNNYYQRCMVPVDEDSHIEMEIRTTALQRTRDSLVIELVRNKPRAAGPGNNPLCMSC
ncbi:MAG: prepilin-type N-terminal cleavage/methylation domain-containing protein [Gemmatimonadota bacterium]